jgi:hypothetical protein
VDIYNINNITFFGYVFEEVCNVCSTAYMHYALFYTVTVFMLKHRQVSSNTISFCAISL